MSIASETDISKPVTLELFELAVVAAKLGHSIVIGLAEYPPIIVRKLWQQVAASLAPNSH